MKLYYADQKFAKASYLGETLSLSFIDQAHPLTY